MEDMLAHICTPHPIRHNNLRKRGSKYLLGEIRTAASKPKVHLDCRGLKDCWAVKSAFGRLGFQDWLLRHGFIWMHTSLYLEMLLQHLGVKLALKPEERRCIWVLYLIFLVLVWGYFCIAIPLGLAHPEFIYYCFPISLPGEGCSSPCLWHTPPPPSSSGGWNQGETFCLDVTREQVKIDVDVNEEERQKYSGKRS